MNAEYQETLISASASRLNDSTEASRITGVAPCYSAKTWEDEFLSVLEAEHNPIPSGITGLDTLFDGGLVPQLYVIGARPGMGKTALAVQMMVAIAKRGIDVYFFSFEITRYDIARRILSLLSHPYTKEEQLSFSDLRSSSKLTGKKHDAFTCVLSEYKIIDEHLYLLDGAEKNHPEPYAPKEIGRLIHDHRIKTGCVPVVFIDHLQRMPKDGAQSLGDRERLEQAVRDLNRIYVADGVPVIVLSELTREGQTKGSSSIDGEAGVTISLLLDGTDEQDREKREKAMKAYPRRIYAEIGKNRTGRTGGARLAFYGKTGYFEDNEQ